MAAYDDKEDARAPDEVALLRRLGMTPESSVLEFGPGTGQFTVAVAPACAAVTAVDVSALMLDRLRAKLSERGLDNVELVQAGLLSYDREPGSVDVAYSRLALHHLPDFWKVVALDRPATHAPPGRDRAAGGCGLRLRARPGRGADRGVVCPLRGRRRVAQWNRADVEEHVRDEHSTFTWLLEPMMRRSGFEIVSRGVHGGWRLGRLWCSGSRDNSCKIRESAERLLPYRAA